ncbi:MAG: hypothetical protein U0625_00120 [Phycisphaerales bacterium]
MNARTLLTKVALVMLAALGGAAVNVVIAFGICLRLDEPGFPTGSAIDTAWFEARGIAPPTNLTCEDYAGFGKVVTLLDADSPRAASGAAGGATSRVRFGERTRIGWPLLSFDGGWCNRAPKGRGQEWVGMALPSPRVARLLGKSMVPIQPIAVGFVLNTALYGVLLWQLGRLLRWLRARRRIRRGCCVSCGYRLGDACVCPECGAARVAAPHATMR